MTELATKLQGLVQEVIGWLSSLPYWGALLVVFAPVLLALLTRSGFAVIASSLLSATAVAILAGGSNITLAGVGALIAFSGALLVSIYPLHDRHLRKHIAALEEHLEHMDEQMTVFLQALDQRTADLDQIRAEASKASDIARRATEAQRRVPASRPPQPAAVAKQEPARTDVTATGSNLDG